jgi:hypothetical protein
VVAGEDAGVFGERPQRRRRRGGRRLRHGARSDLDAARRDRGATAGRRPAPRRGPSRPRGASGGRRRRAAARLGARLAGGAGGGAVGGAGARRRSGAGAAADVRVGAARCGRDEHDAPSGGRVSSTLCACPWYGTGPHSKRVPAATPAVAAAAVARLVARQRDHVAAPGRRAHAVPLARHGREVEHDERVVVAVAAHVAHDALVAVAHVDPVEAVRVVVVAPERRWPL